MQQVLLPLHDLFLIVYYPFLLLHILFLFTMNHICNTMTTLYLAGINYALTGQYIIWCQQDEMNRFEASNADFGLMTNSYC